MSQNTTVMLYQCYRCGRQVYMRDIEQGKACRCGSWHVRYLNPTWWNALEFYLNNPRYIKTWFIENVWGALWKK